MKMEQVDQARILLKNVVDPELGLNIVDLGLIYELMVENNRCYVQMTFTTMGCPISGAMVNGVYDALQPLGFDDIKVDITYNPPWTPQRMTEEGKKRLGVR
jgi:metal-sulfur cluster biosynthetic enzyme